MTTYAESGVNIEWGDDVSKILFEAAKQTWNNRKGLLGEVFNPLDDFSGLRVISVGNLPSNTVMCLGFDGIGTKVELGERLEKHDTLAYDLFAMVCDDAVVRGGEPVLVGSVLDVNALGKDESSFRNEVIQMAKGYVAAAKEARVAVINGEVAELGARVGGYGKFNYNWSSGCVWFAQKERLFTGFEVKAGDSIVALQEKGFRSNGLSLARRIFKNSFGEEWHNEKWNGTRLGELVLHPSKIYSAFVSDLFGGYAHEPLAQVHGVVHVTGGGVPGKLGRILKASQLGADLDNAFTPPEVMRFAQEKGNVTDEEAYRTWNMGNGMLVISPEPETVIAEAKKNGIVAQLAGKVSSQKGIRISSKGMEKPNQWLNF